MWIGGIIILWYFSMNCHCVDSQCRKPSFVAAVTEMFMSCGRQRPVNRLSCIHGQIMDHDCWRLGGKRIQGIDSHVIKKVLPEYSSFCTRRVNSLWAGGAILPHRSGSTLAQVIAWCLMAPSHYLNQCWLLSCMYHQMFHVAFIGELYFTRTVHNL